MFKDKGMPIQPTLEPQCFDGILSVHHQSDVPPHPLNHDFCLDDTKVDGLDKKVQHTHGVSISDFIQDTIPGDITVQEPYGASQPCTQPTMRQLYLTLGGSESISPEAIIHHDASLTITSMAGHLYFLMAMILPLMIILLHVKYLLTSNRSIRRHKYRCATQQVADDCMNDQYTKARVGEGDTAWRFVTNIELLYNIDKGSFKNQELAKLAKKAMKKAIASWKNAGIQFRQVQSSHEAHFQIRFCELPDNRDSTVYAEAFFPWQGRGILYIYGLALEPYNKEHLAKVLAHEIGHILGLRHEEAHYLEWSLPSVLWGKPNPMSVMNYFPTVADWSNVQEQDIEEVVALYELPDGSVIREAGWSWNRWEVWIWVPGACTVRSITPRLYQFSVTPVNWV